MLNVAVCPKDIYWHKEIHTDSGPYVYLWIETTEAGAKDLKRQLEEEGDKVGIVCGLAKGKEIAEKVYIVYLKS